MAITLMNGISEIEAHFYANNELICVQRAPEVADQYVQANLVDQERRQYENTIASLQTNLSANYENTIASLQTNLGPMIFSVDREEDSKKIPWPKRILNALCKF